MGWAERLARVERNDHERAPRDSACRCDTSFDARDSAASAAFPDGVATVKQLVTAGVAERTVYNRCLEGGPWQRVLPGAVLLFSGRLTRRQLVVAALLLGGEDVVVTGLEACRRHSVRRGPVGRDGRDAAGDVRRLRASGDIAELLSDAVQRGPCSVSVTGELAEGSRSCRAVPRGVLRDVDADPRFDGCIAGPGTAAGLRVVVGHWPKSPYGAFSDVMAEWADGHRVLLAPTPEVADFVTGTYRFDEVPVVPVEVKAGAAPEVAPLGGLVSAQRSRVCAAWTGRGRPDTCAAAMGADLAAAGPPPPAPQAELAALGELPPWLGERVHASHRAALVRKDPTFYGPVFPDADPSPPYFWPV